MPKRKPKKGQPAVNEALKGFDIRINEFGEIVSNVQIEQLNEFLDKNVEDKKLAENPQAAPKEQTGDEEKE